MTSLDEVPATLRGLVERYSPSGQEGEASAWLVERMLSSGFTRAFLDPAGNPTGLMGSGPRQLVLLGHIDTVPGQIPPRDAQDDYYGRGSVDAKGSLAAFVDAVAALGAVPGWQIVVVGAVREETDSGGARYAAGQFHPEAAIIGEPSRWDRVTLGYKGMTWFQLTARRPITHSARPDETACEAAFSAWDRVQSWTDQFNQGRAAAFDQLFTSLRGFDSGDDGFEEWASLRINLRLPTDLSPTAAVHSLAEAAAPVMVDQEGVGIPTYRGDKNSALVRAFLQGVRSQGGQPGFVLKTGTADLNIVAPAWDCPAVAYGPGDSTLDHTSEEHISLEEYRRAVCVLVQVLRQMTSAN